MYLYIPSGICISVYSDNCISVSVLMVIGSGAGSDNDDDIYLDKNNKRGVLKGIYPH
jgi:hypothetical protein